MSIEAFCRYFKKTTHQTFTQFLNSYRISQSKRHLIAGKSIGNACYASGFESLSYYHRVFKKITKESPSDFKKRHVNPH
jgi:AraC-like DNA-binding protein